MNRSLIRGLQLRSLPFVVVAVTTCDSDVSAPAVEPIGFGKAYDVWRPVGGDTCSPSIHNQYSTVGPDGRLYPTWHPPTDPATGCTFGHEHGRDPRGSDLYGWIGDIPFGYANEMQDIADPQVMRHEDHVGHKIEWENDVGMHFADGGNAVLDVRCDVLAKLHQGTHSKDAFTNNVHELVYAIRCSDRTEMHVTVLAAIGTPGEFVSACDRERHVPAGVPSPTASPNGNGKRAIPDRSCIEQHLLVAPGERSNYRGALHESWETHTQIKQPNGHTIASFDPYFQVFMPSRYFDATQPGNVGRPIAVCYEVQNGERAQGGVCEESTHDGALTGLVFDDARSPFNGVRRQMDINGNRIDNPNGPELWYTDPFGRKASIEPFPGSIRQFIGRVDNTGRVPRGPTIGGNRDYGGPGVHAPN